MNVNIDYALITEKGTRKINEDAIGVCDNNQSKCFILCDGLGGHGMGDIASSIVVNSFKNQHVNFKNPVDFFKKGFETAQKQILIEQDAKKAYDKMKTTAVLLLFDKKRAHIGYVGDSRAYVFQKGKVKTRTLDHSIPQMLVLSKEIKENQIRNHPDRNMLLRVMGVEWDEPKYELLKPVLLKKGQAFLLCSDGFWELIEEEVMLSALRESNSAKEWLETMLKVIEENGTGKEMDNFSAIAIRTF